MKTHFGFLLRNEVFSAELPDEVDAAFHLGATAGLNPGVPTSIQCAPRGHTDFADFGWSKDFQANAGSSIVDVYRSKADTKAIMPVWDLQTYDLWMQLHGNSTDTRSEALAKFVNGLQVRLDSSGIPRVRLTGLYPGNPYREPINRDHVLFQVRGSIQMLIFRYDGALGTDGVSTEGGYALAAATTPLGVSVLFDGPVDEKGSVLSTAREVAASLRRLE